MTCLAQFLGPSLTWRAIASLELTKVAKASKRGSVQPVCPPRVASLFSLFSPLFGPIPLFRWNFRRFLLFNRSHSSFFSLLFQVSVRETTFFFFPLCWSTRDDDIHQKVVCICVVWKRNAISYERVWPRSRLAKLIIDRWSVDSGCNSDRVMLLDRRDWKMVDALRDSLYL